MVIWAGAAEDPLLRIRAEYLEMPGLSLTEKQACRLWGLDPLACAALLDELVAEQFLRRTRDGAFVRVNAGPLLRRVG